MFLCCLTELNPMTEYSEQWSQYRQLRFLTFVPLAACFVCAFLIPNSSATATPIIRNVVGVADLLCFLTFGYNGVKLGRFRCPRCSNYFQRGKRLERQNAVGRCCRHCGLKLGR